MPEIFVGHLRLLVHGWATFALLRCSRFRMVRERTCASLTDAMLAYAEILAPDGIPRLLGHGDIIGRLWTAALVIEDPRISEAHALISLRGSTLRLLALRGRFHSDGQQVTDLALRTGQEITLADGVSLTVVRLCVPPSVLGIQGVGMPPQMLQGVCSIVATPTAMLVSGMRPDAGMWMWNDGRNWLCRGPGLAARLLDVGDEIIVGDQVFRVVSMLVQPKSGETVLDHFGEAPLHIVVRFDTAHIYRSGKAVAALEGIGARLLTELVLVNGPIGWRALANELWQDGADAQLQRQRLDVALTRLRGRLRACGVRPDLVRSTGTGHLELFLNQFDSVEDAA